MIDDLDPFKWLQLLEGRENTLLYDATLFNLKILWLNSVEGLTCYGVEIHPVRQRTNNLVSRIGVTLEKTLGIATLYLCV